MSYYALTDSDWQWDDEAEGRAIVVRADTPEEAVKIATEKHIAEFPGAGGICWKVARLWNLGLEMADWEDDNKPNYDGFDYYPDGCNGPMDPSTAAMSKKGRWRVFESVLDRTHFGIELEAASNDDDPILYSMKIRRETVQAIVDAHNASLASPPTPRSHNP